MPGEKMKIAELGVKIDTSEAAQAAENLDKVTKAGEQAEKSAVSLMNEMKALEKSLSTGAKTTQELSRQREALAKLTKTGAYGEAEFTKITAQLDKQQVALVKSTLDEQKALNSLLSAIDPAKGKLAQLDKQVESLGKHLDAGRISQEQYNSALGKIDKDYAKLEKTTTGFDKLRLGTRQAQENVMQLGNALSSGDFASGARAIVQLGAGAGASAAGLALMIGPLAAIVGAIGALGVAYYQGAKEQDAYRLALVTTGNAAGTTTSALAAMAKRVSGVVGTTAEAASALAMLAGNGKLTSDSFEEIAIAAISFEKATGKAVSETIAEFAKIAEDPVKAVAELNEKYNFLTAAVYEQVRAAQEQGDKQAAATIAEEAYAQALKSRAGEMKKNLGSLERAWNDLASAASSAWDSILNIGRASNDGPDLEKIQQKINYLKSTLNTGYEDGDAKKRIKDLQDVLDGFAKKSKAEQDAADQAREAARVQREGQAAYEEFQKSIERNFTKQQKMNKALEDEQKRINAARAAGYIISEKAESAALKAIRENSIYKEAKTPKAKAYTENAGIKALDNAKQQYSVLLQQSAVIDQQALSTEKVGIQAQALIKWEQQLADIKEKKILTADQKSLLANQELITAQLKRNAEVEKRITQQKQAMESIKQAEKDRIELLKLTGQALAANAANSGVLEAQQRLKYEREGNAEALKRLEVLKQIRDANLKASQKLGTVEGVSKAPTAAGLDAVVGGSKSEIERLNISAREVEDWRSKELEKQKTFLDLKAINEETYAARVENINQQGRDAQTRIEQAKNTAILSSTSDFFGNMAVLSQSENKKLAAIGKAAAIAQATVDGFLAVQKALAAFPPPFNFIAAAAVGVATAANVANIAGVGYKVGGYTGDGDPNDVAGPVHKREFVFNAPSVARIGVGRLEALQSGELSVDSPAANYAVPAGGSTAASASAESRGASRRSSRNSPSVIQNINVSGLPDNRTANQIAAASSRKQRQASRLK